MVNEQQQQIQEAVGGDFKDPTGSSKMVGSDMHGSGENFIVTKDNMKELKEQLQKSIREIPKFDEPQKHIRMTITNEGLRIELTENANGIFFERGSEKMSSEGSHLVRLLAKELGQLPDTIAIEDHSDAKPYPPGALYTNWELSSDRANCTRRVMQANGIRPDPSHPGSRFRLPAFCARPMPPRPLEPRISLIVQYLEKKKDATPLPETEKSPDAAPAKTPPLPGGDLSTKK